MKVSLISSFFITIFSSYDAVIVNGISIQSASNGETLSRRSVLNSITATAVTATAAMVPTEGAIAAGQDNLVIPGVAGGAPFRNMIVDEGTVSRDNKGQTQTSTTASSISSIIPITKLGKSRLLATELPPLTPSLVPFASDNELYYDPFLLGSWTTTATLRRKVYPYGTEYLPSPSLYDGSPRNRAEQPGDSATYEVQYVNAADGKIDADVNVGKAAGREKLKIISERAFNAFSINAGYDQLSQLNEVQWDRKKDPTRLTFVFSTLGQDMQPLGQKKAEIYITARKSETGIMMQDPTVTGDTASGDGGKVFCSSERVRSVTVVPGNVVVSDTETITEFHPVIGSNGNHIKALSRIAVYLTPNPNSREGLLWQDVNGKAVAFFDYELDMKRNNPVNN